MKALRMPALLLLVLAVSLGPAGVAFAAPPANDARANAIAVAAPSQTLGTNVEATADGPNPCVGINQRDVWYKVTPGSTGNLTIDTFGSNYDTALAAYAAGSNTSLACNDDTAGLQSRITIAVTAGTTYDIQVGGFFGSQGSITLNVGSVQAGGCNDIVPPNDCRANATTIAALPSTNTQSTASAGLEVGEPQPCGGMNSTVWFRFTAPSTDQVTVDSFTSNYDTVLAAYNSGSNASLACNDDSAGLQSQITFSATAGNVYNIQAGGFFGQTGNLVLHVAVGCPPNANNCFEDAAVVTGPVYEDSVNTFAMTREPGEPNPSCSFAGVTVGRTVWYEFTPTVGGTLATTLLADFDTVIGIYEQTGTGFGGLVEVGCNDDTIGEPAFLILQSTVLTPTVAGTTYYIQVGGWGGGGGNLTLDVVGL